MSNRLVEEKLSYTVDEFPKLKVFDNNFEKIQEEFFAINDAIPKTDIVNCSYNKVPMAEMVEGAIRFIQRHGKMGWVRGTDFETKEYTWDWIHFPLYYRGIYCPQVEQSMPVTKMCIDEIKDYVHSIDILKLSPDTELGIHKHSHHRRDDTLVYHLTLKSASDGNVFLQLEDQTKLYHNEGESFIFAGYNYHYAANFSTEDRYIIFIEFNKIKILEN